MNEILEKFGKEKVDECMGSKNPVRFYWNLFGLQNPRHREKNLNLLVLNKRENK